MRAKHIFLNRINVRLNKMIGIVGGVGPLAGLERFTIAHSYGVNANSVVT